jgi:hypothetical protein
MAETLSTDKEAKNSYDGKERYSNKDGKKKSLS